MSKEITKSINKSLTEIGRIERMTKFTIGSRWKTRGGWRAVVVDAHDDGLRVWHSYSGGCNDCNRLGVDDCLYSRARDYDLIEPWVEPKTGKCTTIVFENKDGCLEYATSEDGAFLIDGNILAIKEVNWTEGEGL